jgi:hypothetical protein
VTAKSTTPTSPPVFTGSPPSHEPFREVLDLYLLHRPARESTDLPEPGVIRGTSSTRCRATLVFLL